MGSLRLLISLLVGEMSGRTEGGSSAEAMIRWPPDSPYVQVPNLTMRGDIGFQDFLHLGQMALAL